MEHILVTGAKGFTGQYVVNELKNKGYKVSLLVRNALNTNEYSCDITDFEQVSCLLVHLQPDRIIHLAAISFVGHSDEKLFYDVNLFGTQNLLKAAKKLSGLKKIVVASSANIYGEQGLDPITEKAIPDPKNHYAISKLSMEYICRINYKDLPLVITRPFNYIGYGQDECFLIPKIVNHFKLRKPVIELGNINVSRDFSDVRDIAKYYVAIMESDVEGETINLCSGKSYSIMDIINYLSSITNHEIQINVNPEFVRDNEINFLLGSRDKLDLICRSVEVTDISDTLKIMLKE